MPGAVQTRKLRQFMILPRRFVLLGLILAVLPAAAQTPSTAPAPPSRPAALPTPAAEEHNSRLIARYRAMLEANPVEGLALDRLWDAARENGTTGTLLEDYRRASEAQPPPLSALLVYGHLLQKAGHLDEAKSAFGRAIQANTAGVLAPLALGDLAASRAQPAEAAAAYEIAAGKLPADDHRRPDILLKLGNAWMAAHEPLKAAEAWEKIVAANPADIALHRRLAENYEKNRLPERSIAHYEYIEQHAEPEQRAGALRELARLHEARGEVEAASAALERGLALTAPGNWLHDELEQSLIRLYQRAGRVPELAARWQAEVAAAPRDLGGYLRLEHLAEAQGDSEGKRNSLEQIVALAPQDRPDTLKLARLLADAGQRDRSAGLYDALLKDQPGNLDLVLARAELDLQLGHPEAAVDRIDACVARTPADESVTTPALQFFLSHHLDHAAETRLRADVARQPQADEPALALARFYFDQRREAEARATLEKLLLQPADAAAGTARLLRVADCYKDEHLLDDALRCWQKAADLSPSATVPWLAMADTLAGEGKTDAAQDAFEHALKLAPPGSSRDEIERKLLELLQAADAGSASVGRVELKLGGPPLGPSPLSGGRRLTRYISQLEETARAKPSADAYLELARWESWNNATTAASVAAEKVLTLDPANIPARELLVTIASELHQRDVAEQRLQEIIKLDPARSAACRRQIAELKMDGGDFDAAITLFSALQADAPGSIPALTDLALAEQRAERWYDALTTWERAYALPGATPTERTDVRRSMLPVLERLGQFPRGAEILQAAIDEQTDLAARQDLLQELIAYCQRHDLTGWLQQQYDERLAAQPTDYFTLTAEATLQKASGHPQEAYRLLRQADFSSPDPVHSLQALATAAEALGETAEAVSWQRRLLALTGQDTADNLEKLANLQDDGFDIDAAAATWNQAVERFPRETGILDKAAVFFEKNRRLNRARELLGQLVAIDPTNLKRVFHLGEIDLAAEDRAGARACFEQVLARSSPEKAGLPILPPPELKTSPPKPEAGFAAAVARFRTRVAVSAPETETAAATLPDDERQLRLAAIREISALLLPSASADDPKQAAPGEDRDRRQWLERWKAAEAAGGRSEPLWAFYFSREQGLTMDTLAGWMKGAPADETLRGMYTNAGLHLGAYRALAHWAWDETDRTQASANGELLVTALIDFLTAGGKPGPAMAAELFPAQANVRELLWKAAHEGFAAQDWYGEAAELGERVVAVSSSARANFALPVAQWELYLGRTERARSVLRTALAQSSGDSFEPATSPVFVVLREFFLLLPESERAGFADEYLRRMPAGRGPAHAVLSAVLLHGLLGDWETAEGDIDRLLALRMLASDAGAGSTDVRRWNYVLVNGLQLEEWGLEPLALHLWQRALRQASAFEIQDNETLTIRSELRTRLLGLQVALAPDPSRARQAVEDYLRELPQPGSAALLADQFRKSAQWPAAVLLYQYLCRVEPGDPEYWKDLLAAYKAAGDNAAYSAALAAVLDGTQPAPNALGRVDLICRQAAALEEEGDGENARRLLERARLKAPRSVPLLAQLANSYLLAGRADQAAELWRQALAFDPEGHAALALAALEDSRHRRPEAIEVLKEARLHVPANFEVTVQLGRLYAAAGQIEDLRALATERLQAGDLNALISMETGLTEQPACLCLRTILAEAARRAHDPQESFRAQLSVVDSYRVPAENDEAALQADLHRLELLAGSTPALRRQFMQARFEVAAPSSRLPWLEADLAREWRAGAGDVEAGEMLVRLYLQSDRVDGLRKTVGEIDRHTNLPELTLFAIEQEVGSSKYAALALPIAQRLTRRFPEKEAYALARARCCWMSGRAEEARSLLDALDVTSVFTGDDAGQIGDLYATLGDRAGAQDFYRRAVARDPWALHSVPAYLHLAQLEIEDKHFDATRRLLLTAYRNPACTDLTPLLAYLGATGRAAPDAANRLPGAEFPLSLPNRARLLTALCEGLEKAHPADARRLAMAHPELWAEAPGLVDDLCTAAGPDEWAGLALALESAVQQTDPPNRQLARSLAGLYVKWASAELKDSVHASNALAQLARAHELQPDDFPLARQLAELYVEKKQTARATAVLHDFLTADAFPAERRQAQQILAQR